VVINDRGLVRKSDVGAVVLNVTVVGPSDPGFASVFPLDTAAPTASSVNFAAGQTVPNLVIAKIGRGGGISIVTSANAADVIVDVMGYYPGVSTADAAGGYAALGRDSIDMPISYDRCYGIPYAINPYTAPAGWVQNVVDAFDAIHAITGLTFIRMDDTAEPGTRDDFDQAGNPRPLIVAFGNANMYPELSGSVVGYAGSSYGSATDGWVRLVPEQYITGAAIFDSGESLQPGFGSGNAFGKVALHELGHVVGLGHVDNTDELMNAYIIQRSGSYGQGDTVGLSLLYKTQSCAGSPASFQSRMAPGKDLLPTDGPRHVERTMETVETAD
jgi:hypothetical protein